MCFPFPDAHHCSARCWRGSSQKTHFIGTIAPAFGLSRRDGADSELLLLFTYISVYMGSLARCALLDPTLGHFYGHILSPFPLPSRHQHLGIHCASIPVGFPTASACQLPAHYFLSSWHRIVLLPAGSSAIKKKNLAHLEYHMFPSGLGSTFWHNSHNHLGTSLRSEYLAFFWVYDHIFTCFF